FPALVHYTGTERIILTSLISVEPTSLRFDAPPSPLLAQQLRAAIFQRAVRRWHVRVSAACVFVAAPTDKATLDEVRLAKLGFRFKVVLDGNIYTAVSMRLRNESAVLSEVFNNHFARRKPLVLENVLHDSTH